MFIPGYALNDQLVYNSLHTRILSGERIEDKQPVVFKLLQDEYPSPTEIERFKNEYEITKCFDSPSIVHVYGTEKWQNKSVIILELIQGKTLAEKIKKEKRPSLLEFLALALKIAEALGEIHQHQVIHNDINPSNIFYNPETKNIKIIDFGLSVTLKTERAPVINPNVIIGTLPYISPEQTGRMNRGIDYRTDFYSLGVTYYQLLTGQLPFTSQDPMELIHGHIAIVPKSPSEIDPEIPIALSAIVMKLLAKNADERYLNANGLIADLKECQKQLEMTGRIDPFILGVHDLFNRFQIPEKLYGREKEKTLLLNTYERVVQQGQAELMLVTGYSGIGKSSLVHEIQRTIVNQRGYFVSGKFDQFKHNIPYSALTQAFSELVNQILMESKAKIASFREKILNVVKGNGQILIDIIPNLVLIIGEQPPMAKLEPTEGQNLLSLTFQNLITVLAAAEHPLCIFLDDLQWADLPSLKLIETLLESNCRHLLIIGAYRSNEVDGAHPLMTTIDSLKKNNIVCHSIELLPLTLDDVTALIADTLHQDHETMAALAEVCYKKTVGNPFFLIQVLEKLYEEQLIEFDSKKNQWKWDIDRIQKEKITDNVADLLLDKIRKLPSVAQRALQIAACIGSKFNVALLSKATNIGYEEIFPLLLNVMKEGFVIREGSVNDLPSYQFAHDRIQQAAYSMLSEDENKLIHLNLARILSQNTSSEAIKENIFDIVNHYNIAIESMTPNIILPDEKIKIAEINLQAAKMAKSSAAYEPALRYAEASIKCQDKDAWTSNYPLIFETYVEATENAILCAKFDLMKKYITISIAHAKDIYDEITINSLQFINTQHKRSESIDSALKMLAKLGIKLNPNPNKLDTLIEVYKVKFLLLGKKISALYDLPLLNNRTQEAAQTILYRITPTVFFTRTHLAPTVLCRSLAICIRYGNSKIAPTAYAGYGFICCAFLDQLENGYEFGKLSIRTMEKFNPQFKAHVMNVFYTFIAHWKDPVKEIAPQFLEGYENGLNNGDLEYAFYNFMSYIYNLFYCGSPLKEISKIMEPHLLFIKSQKAEYAYDNLCLVDQVIYNLVELRTETIALEGHLFDERKEPGSPNILLKINFFKLMLSCIYERYTGILQMITACDLYQGSYVGTLVIPLYNFYKSLALLAIYPTSDSKEKKKIKKTVKQNQKQMKKWIDFSSCNHAQKYFLIEAEWTNIVLEDPLKAIPIYNQAISWANKNEYIQDEALANERLAKLYLSQKNEKIARVYLKDARQAYLLWGAEAKVAQLDKKYGQLLKQHSLSSGTLTSLSLSTTTDQTLSTSLDIGTIQKCSQAISSTIILTDLLKNLMLLLIENAGAERSFFILNKDGEYLIEAEGAINESNPRILHSLAVTDNILPTSIINFVINTHESVVLDNAVVSEQFAKDPYIIKTRPKSVLCIPLLNQGTLTGLLYLENNLAAGSFTKNRIDLLNMISSQIAISIDNARLYANTVELNEHLATLNTSYERFVPKDFLSLLQKKSILQVTLGDHIEKEMSVLFTDIRNFTTISEKMTPEQNFNFINSFLNLIAPIISKHHGFIDKYIGDAIMALYPESADDAVQSALEMQQVLKKYNETQRDQEPIKIGIGINTGLLMLGTVGEEHRLGATVISDSVNIASRVESLTKVYNEKILITQETYVQLKLKSYSIEKVADTFVKGKSEKVTIYKVAD